jgi:hypothetical protein
MAARLVDNNTNVWWVTTLSSTTAPTATQINAGVALEGFITADGLDISPDQNFVDVSVLNSASELQDFGRTKVDASLTMKRDSTDTAWTTFASQPSGYLVVRRGVANTTTGTAAQKVEVYPVKASNRFPVKPAANDMEKFMVKFALTADYVAEATVA